MDRIEEHPDVYPQYINAPIEMIWELTGKCACHCIYCGGDFPCEYNEAELSRIEKFALAQELINHHIFTINLSGGEPFYCNELYELAQMFNEAGIHTSINTAGFNVDQEVLKKLCRLDRLAFCISIDSCKKEINDRIRGKAGALDAALQLIDGIKQYGNKKIPIVIECVISKLNFGELDSIIEFFSAKEVTQLRFQQVVLAGRARDNREKISLNEGILLKELIDEKSKAYYEKCKENPNELPMEIHFVNQALMIKTGITRGLNWGGIISPVGKMKPSAYLDLTTDSYRNYGSFINLWNAGYRSIWKRSEIIELLKNVENIWDICKIKDQGADRITITFES